MTLFDTISKGQCSTKRDLLQSSSVVFSKISYRISLKFFIIFGCANLILLPPVSSRCLQLFMNFFRIISITLKIIIIPHIIRITFVITISITIVFIITFSLNNWVPRTMSIIGLKLNWSCCEMGETRTMDAADQKLLLLFLYLLPFFFPLTIWMFRVVMKMKRK